MISQLQRRMCHLIAVTVLLAVSVSSQAVLIDNGNITSDTATGLHWLDLTQSTNLSVGFVSTQFGAGGQFAGFRYATNNEVQAMILSEGFSLGTVSGDSGVLGFTNLFGVTLSGSGPGGLFGVQGFTDDGINNGLPGHARLSLRRTTSGFNTTVSINNGSTFSTSLSNGHWLVTTTLPQPPGPSLPEPATLGLVFAGLVGLRGRYRRRG